MTISTTLDRIGGSRPLYAAVSLIAFFSQHLFVWTLFSSQGGVMRTPWWFWINPLGAGFQDYSAPPGFLLAAMVFVLAIDTLLALLAYRRSSQSWGSPAIAALVIAPAAQVFAILWLSLVPNRADQAKPDEKDRRLANGAVIGVIAGAALCVVAVGLSAVVFHSYGYTLFLFSPFAIGLVIGYWANRGGDIGFKRTWAAVLAGLLLGAAALMGLALEGLICLVMASPLIGVMGLLGGVIGRLIARQPPIGKSGSMMSVSFIPLLLVAETLLPPSASFESYESIVVAAPPSAVWTAVIEMKPIPDPPPAPFRWGLAYPMKGEIHGSGVGAVRRGVFSTGVAYERVTEWEPGKKLSFIVLSDPPTMNELSPYPEVHAPHVQGYFRTLDARFTLTSLADGKTRLTLATKHELDLEPALYWTPWAQWAVHTNKRRVLEHFKLQAETAGL